jgi:cation diffusion facilitator family transporter
MAAAAPQCGGEQLRGRPLHRHTLADHGHDHVFLGAGHERHERRTLWVVALTAAMMAAEIAAGLAFGSMALLADGFHMATHAGAMGVAAFAYAYARRHARDARFTFGTGKIGDLAGFASALALALFAVGIAAESVERLFVPAAVAFREALWVAALGLLVNLVSAWLLGAGHDHHDHGHDHAHDHNLRSAYLHVLADALTSVLAIVALLAGRHLDWVWLDPAMGIVGAVVIARWAWGLMRDTAAVLVDAAPSNELADEVRAAIERDGDAKVADLHLWRVGPGRFAAIVSLVAADPLDAAAYKARLAEHRELAHVTVETHRCDRHA